MPRISTIGAYVSIFAVIISLISIGYRSPQNSPAVANTSTTVDQSSSPSAFDKPSVDEVVATDIVATVAEASSLPVAPNVANLSISLAARNELAQTDDTVISKPQIVQATSQSRSISTYTTKTGDTVASVATQYGISAQTIKWANNLTSDALEPGKSLTILPVDGVLYKVKGDDTLDSIASKYQSDKNRIVTYNDLELGGLKADTQIILPGGVLPETERPGYVAPVARSSYGGGSSSGYRIAGGLAQVSAGNRYAFGNCTWYAYERRMQLGRPVGSFWGNGGSWGYSAASAGFLVDHHPEAGAVLVQAGSPGHVAIVEEVLSNGDIRISEMNYYGGGGGFNIVSGRVISAGQAAVYSYIH